MLSADQLLLLGDTQMELLDDRSARSYILNCSPR